MKLFFSFDSQNKNISLKIPENAGNPLFITTLLSIGFFDSGNNEYIFDANESSESDLFKLTRKLTELLSSEKIKYTMNEEAAELIKKSGLELKKHILIKNRAKNYLRLRASLRMCLHRMNLNEP